MGQSPSQNYSKVVNTLIFIFPIVIITLQVAGDIVLFILAMMGIYVAISKKISPFVVKEIKVFSYLAIGYFMAICLSVVFSGQALELAHYIPRDFYFLFAPFIALTLYKAEINVNYLLAGIKVGLIILGIMIYNQLLSGVYRPSGVMNAGVFGNLAVSLFFIALVFFQHETFIQKIFTLISLLSGLLIIVASGTRGAWLSFLLLIGVYLYFIYKQNNNLRKKLKIIIVLIIISLLTIGIYNQSVNSRLQQTITGISNWLSYDKSVTNVREKISPVSERLSMYSVAIDNIKDVPFFGHGYRTSNIILYQNDMTPLGKLAVEYNHLHNAYLTNYYNGGIPLLGALLLLLFAPFTIFIKANRQSRENPVFVSGALLTLGYASFGMVNILLGDTYMNGFYVFFLAIFLLLTNKSIKLPKT
jgi:O-antigen ligase